MHSKFEDQSAAEPVGFGGVATRADRKRRRMLYLTTFNPTVASTGTTTRGKLFLRYFCEHYDVHLVHMDDPDNGVEDEELIASLASKSRIAFSKWHYFIYSAELLRTADELLKKHAVDFIFADFDKSGMYAHILSKRHGVPYFYNSHNIEHQRYVSVANSDWRRYALVPYVYLTERIACRNAAFTIAITEPDAEVLRRWAPPSSVVAYPSAFDESVFNPFHAPDRTADTQRPVVLMVGNFNNPANRDGALRMLEVVIPEVVSRRPDVLFRFVGIGFPEHISHPNVESVGFVENLVDEYPQVTAIVVPIESGGGIKIKAVEGLAVGKFLVSTPKGMEGIDYSSYDMVRVGPLEDFPGYIVEALDHPAPRTTANWDKVRRELGCQSNLRKIRERIERLLSSGALASAHMISGGMTYLCVSLI